MRAVLTALLEDRLYFPHRRSDKIFIVKSTEGDLDRLRTRRSAVRRRMPGDAPGCPDQNRHQQQAAAIAEDDARAFRAVEPRRRGDGSARCRTCCARSDEATVALLRERKAVETDAGVKKEIATGLALADLDWIRPRSAPRGHRDSVEQAQPGRAEQARRACWRKSPDGTFVEPDETVRTAAARRAGAHRLAGERFIPRSRRCSSA